MVNSMDCKKEFESIIERAIADGAFPGATYAIVSKNKVTLGSLGYKELYEEKIENTVDTIYDMASLTKVICTTTCIMQLVEKGLIRIYDSVNMYLPLFKFKDITIWNLLTHTSGLPEGIYGRKDILTAEDIWNKIYNEVELMYIPGKKISYSDINYILLGKIVEVVTKMKLNEYAKENVFIPLEMKDTGYLPQDKIRCAATEYRDDESYHGYVKGYVHDETAFSLGGVAGHAGLFSTSPDMVHFVQMILNDGIYNGKQILSKTTVNKLFEVQVKEYDGVEVYPKARCLGWQTLDPYSAAGELVSRNTILHTGFTGTNVFIDKDNGIGFVFLTNRVHPTRNNAKHLHYRACLANYIMTHLEYFN